MLIPKRFFQHRPNLLRIAGGLSVIIVIFLIRLYITSDAVAQKTPVEPPAPPPPLPRHPLYKPPKEKPSIPIEDNFPRAARAKSGADLPQIPSWNTPPSPHVSEPTPVFIGFTRNWRLLQQAVVSLITAGWPQEDIYVVENTGTMDANKNVQLSLQNPFYLDYYRLTEILGVNVITTPTLLTFAQLQNFFLYEAITKGYPTYFWAHMDGAALSDEKRQQPYRSFYNLSVEALRESQDPKYGRWGIRFFAYDHFALVNTKAYVEVGGWDTQIPFYLTDCDMHERLFMRGFKLEPAGAGQFFDLSEAIDDLEELYRKRKSENSEEEEEDELGGAGYDAVNGKLGEIQHRKVTQEGGRNTWQAQQAGGQGEPYYRDPDGFEQGLYSFLLFFSLPFSCSNWHEGLSADLYFL
jgi:hypothetical protein